METCVDTSAAPSPLTCYPEGNGSLQWSCTFLGDGPWEQRPRTHCWEVLEAGGLRNAISPQAQFSGGVAEGQECSPTRNIHNSRVSSLVFGT